LTFIATQSMPIVSSRPSSVGEDQLRADAVGAERQAEAGGDLEHRGVMAGAEGGARRAAGVDRAQDVDERAHAAVGDAGVNAGGGVGVAHRPPFWRRRRTTAAASARR
jgi:hypothetical protein